MSTVLRRLGRGRSVPWWALVPVLVAVVLAVPSTVRPVQAASGGFLEGRVTDADGRPVTMLVIAFPVGSNAVAGVTPSIGGVPDAQGSYRLGPLPPGQYQLLVRQEPFGEGWAWRWYGGVTDRAASPAVTVTADATVSGVDVVTQPGGRFHGRVAAGDGHPIGCCRHELKDIWFEPRLYVDVTVRSVELARDVGDASEVRVGSVADMSVTGDEYLWVDKHRYHVSGLQTGSYRIQVRPQLGGYASRWFDGASTEAEARPVTAQVGTTRTPPVVTFPRVRPHLWPVAGPTWAGSPRVGRTLRISDPGEWQRRPDSYRYSFRLLDERWPGRVLRVRQGMKGYSLKACVTALKDGFVKGTACVGLPQIKKAR